MLTAEMENAAPAVPTPKSRPKKRNKQTSLLLQIATKVAAAETLDEILRYIVEVSVSQTDAERAGWAARVDNTARNPAGREQLVADAAGTPAWSRDLLVAAIGNQLDPDQRQQLTHPNLDARTVGELCAIAGTDTLDVGLGQTDLDLQSPRVDDSQQSRVRLHEVAKLARNCGDNAGDRRHDREGASIARCARCGSGGSGPPCVGLRDGQVGLRSLKVGARRDSLLKQLLFSHQLLIRQIQTGPRHACFRRNSRRVAAFDQGYRRAGLDSIADSHVDPHHGAGGFRGQDRLRIGR